MIEELQKYIIINPSSLPMICPPNKWSADSYGGYLSNHQLKLSLISGSSLNSHGHGIKLEQNLYNSINSLNKIQFTVNSELLEFLLGEGQYILNSIKENEVQRSITLQVAEVFNNVPFYIPVQADWRGRIYTQSFFLSYQGSDLSNALLMYWKGETFTKTGCFPPCLSRDPSFSRLLKQEVVISLHTGCKC